MITQCVVCHLGFEERERVIFSTRETFVFKPAHIPDEPEIRTRKDGTTQEISAAASLSPEALREKRKEHTKTAIVNHFVDWGNSTLPSGAFHFRHQWCEPQRTGAGNSLHPVNKHAIRFGRSMPKRLHG